MLTIKFTKLIVMITSAFRMLGKCGIYLFTDFLISCQTKKENVGSVLKKGDKKMLKNYWQISLLPICEKSKDYSIVTKSSCC